MAGGQEKIVRVWEVATGKVANQWAGFKDHIYAVAITPDGRRILAASGGYWPSGKLTGAEDHTVHMVDLKTKQESKFTGHQGGIWSLSVSGDGQHGLGQLRRHRTRWNLLSGTLLRTLDHNKKIVWSCAFWQDGRYIVSGGDDAIVRFWEAETGRLSMQLAGSTRSITSVGISEANRRAFSSGSENVAPVCGPLPSQLLWPSSRQVRSPPSSHRGANSPRKKSGRRATAEDLRQRTY